MSSFTINVFNSLAPRGKRIIITGILEQADFQDTVDGDVVWALRLVTNFNGKDGRLVDPVYITDVTSENLTREIEKGVSVISSKIDWTQVEEDGRPPFVQELYPLPEQTNTPLSSSVKVRLKDSFPTTGIDPSTIKLRVNGIDVTADIKISGDVNDYLVTWTPPVKLD